VPEARLTQDAQDALRRLNQKTQSLIAPGPTQKERPGQREEPERCASCWPPIFSPPRDVRSGPRRPTPSLASEAPQPARSVPRVAGRRPDRLRCAAASATWPARRDLQPPSRRCANAALPATRHPAPAWSWLTPLALPWQT
jgi:hypothetical protein